MKTFRQHLNTKLKDEHFKQVYDEEPEMLGISQQDLARKAQITQQQLSKIETGMNCNISTLLKVCHALQIKLNLVYSEAAQ